MKWLFLTEKFSEFSGKETETLMWEQKTKFKGETGDEILMLDELQHFSYIYRIQEVNLKQPNEQQSFYQITVQLKQLEKYKDGKELTDYVFSFPRVRNFGTRINRHFSRKYYRMTDIEFDAVDKDNIFVERSMIGTALNAMHKEHQQQFVKFLVERFPRIIQGKIEYQNIAAVLLEYINFAIITPAHQLREAGIILRQLVNKDTYHLVSFDSIVDERRFTPSFIATQVTLIEEHIPTLQTMAEQISGNFERNQSKFHRAFEGRGLPINLN